MVVVYDPAAGVARGNGWLKPPPDGGFDFASNYPTPGSTVPDGAVTFALAPETNLNLRNNQHLDWLVITPDGKIAIKGTSERISGQQVGFVLYAYAGCPQARGAGCQVGPHKFRMLVWDIKEHGQIPEGVPAIFDSRPGQPFDLDEASPAAISNGLIQIQRPPLQ